MKILIEAGHTAHSPGAIAYDGTKEHDLNKEMQAAICFYQSEAVAMDGSAMYPVEEHEHLTLRSVVNLINMTKDLKRGLSIHFNNNNPDVSGTEVFIHPKTSKENKARAEHLSEGISKIIGIKNRGIKFPAQSALGRLAILEDTKVPIILLEVCFLNKYDLPLYRENREEVWEFVRKVMFTMDFKN